MDKDRPWSGTRGPRGSAEEAIARTIGDLGTANDGPEASPAGEPASATGDATNRVCEAMGKCRDHAFPPAEQAAEKHDRRSTVSRPNPEQLAMKAVYVAVYLAARRAKAR